MEQIPTQSNAVFERYVEDFDLNTEELSRPILDVGANSADFIRYIRDVIGNKNAYALDKNYEVISENVDGAVVGDMMHLPFQDNTFDTVVASNILPMFAGDDVQITKSAIEEMLRVTKPKGRIVANITTAENEMNKSNLFIKYSSRNKEHKRRAAGSKKIEDYLFTLKESGLNISINNNKRTPILTIIK